MRLLSVFFAIFLFAGQQSLHAADYKVTQTADQITISTPQLEAGIRKKGYVTGVYRQTFLDKKTGFRDAGFGLDIADWIMEPGSDKAYRAKLDKELIYRYGNPYHGKTAKRSIEGPQICTQAKVLKPTVIRGKDFVGIVQTFRYKAAAPGKKTGSLWTQRIVFPMGKRYFLSMNRIDAVNDSPAMFLRTDMPGHIKHKKGDTFSEVYLSYHGRILAKEFFTNFAPDAKFNYRRGSGVRGRRGASVRGRDAKIPKRFIRAYRLRDPKTGKPGPWLAGMTLDPSVVHEAWCHQRNYVCLIHEFGGKPVKAGGFFRAAFLVGYFDSIEEMQKTYDRYAGHTGLVINKDGWRLVK